MALPPLKTRLRTLGSWLSMQVIPAGFMVFIALYLLQKTNLKFEIAMPIGIVWGSIGAAIHYLSIKRGQKFKLIMTGLFLVVTIATAFTLERVFRIDHSNLVTCEVCGFISLEKQHDLCPVCNVIFSEEEATKEAYGSLEEYLKAEQMMYFVPNPVGSKVDFFAPIEAGIAYRKDPNWRPSIKESDIRDIEKMLENQPK